MVAVVPAAGAAAGAAGALPGVITGTGAACAIVNKGSVMPAEHVFDTPRQLLGLRIKVRDGAIFVPVWQTCPRTENGCRLVIQ